MYVPLRLGFFITARHCASLFFSSLLFLEFCPFILSPGGEASNVDDGAMVWSCAVLIDPVDRLRVMTMTSFAFDNHAKCRSPNIPGN